MNTPDTNDTDVVLEYAFLTTVNRTDASAVNEDAVLIDGRIYSDENHNTGHVGLGESNLFAVADGLHGTTRTEHPARELLSLLNSDFLTTPEDHPGRRVTRLHHAFSALGAKKRRTHGMASTLVAAEFIGRQMNIFHVGDSRAWLVGPDISRLLTKDHTFAQSLLDGGEIDSQAFESAGDIYQALDQFFVVDSAAVRPHNSLITMTLDVGQTLILASDGISMIPGLLPVVGPNESLQQYVSNLAAQAKTAGGDDNISVIAISLNHRVKSKKDDEHQGQ